MAVTKHDDTADAEEAELITRCRAGDRLALRDLYGRHFAIMQRLARRLGTPPAELDDVTQEVFASAFGKLDQFAGGNFGHWIRRICANAVSDLHRRNKVRRAFRAVTFAGPRAEVDSSPTPEGLAAQSQAERQVAQIVASLRPKQREVFVLFELEGLSGEEIAALVGCPLNTVWTRLFHARAAFVRIGQRRGFISDGRVRPAARGEA